MRIKAAADSLTQAMRAELAPQGVAVFGRGSVCDKSVQQRARDWNYPKKTLTTPSEHRNSASYVYIWYGMSKYG